jgi:hypothetical protein
MAPVLQCPDCGARHPLSEVPDTGTFPCSGCARPLKVPEMVARTATSSTPPAAPAAPPLAATAAAASTATPAAEPPAAPNPPDATRAWRAVEKPAPDVGHARFSAPPPPPLANRRTPVPVWIRLLLWIVAVPLGFMVVFGFARATGLLTTNQASDVFLANNIGRFWPIARLLPFVALVTAGIVHGGVLLLGRRRPAQAPARP